MKMTENKTPDAPWWWDMDVWQSMLSFAVVGSEAHGLQSPGKGDTDYMGVCIEPSESIFGLDKFDQVIYRTAVERARREGRPLDPNPRSEDGDIDIVVYGLKKFASLSAKGNPSILIMLFVTPMNSHRYWDDVIIANRNVFLSKRAGSQFLGYLKAQKERLQGHRGQMRITRTELIDKYGYDTKYAMHAVRLGFQGVQLMDEGVLSLPMRDSELEICRSIREGNYSFESAIAQIESLEDRLLKSISHSRMPDEPDRLAINRMLERIYVEFYGI